jgi:hypothetical protein
MPPLTRITLRDTLVCQSKPSTTATLCVSVHDLPADAYAIEETEGYCFAYRRWANRGNTWATAPGLNLAHQRIGRGHCLVVPPHVPIRVEWTNAAGRVARFEFSSHFLEAIADQMGVPSLVFKPPVAVFFSFDPHLEALCRLLFE